MAPLTRNVPRTLMAALLAAVSVLGAGTAMANTGHGRGPLALTDPDSSQVVPPSAPRFGGDFMLTSQGDKEQIYVRGAGTAGQRLFVLRLSRAADDTAWATSASGRLYATDNAGDAVDVVTGRFRTGTVFEAVTPVRCQRRPGHLPRARVPGELRGCAQPVDGRHQPGTAARARAAPAGDALRRWSGPAGPVTEACPTPRSAAAYELVNLAGLGRAGRKGSAHLGLTRPGPDGGRP
jgi:hypothetical protein